MKVKKLTLFYIITIGCLLGCIYVVFKLGEGLQSSEIIHKETGDGSSGVVSVFVKAFSHPLSVFILQLILIITISRFFSFIFKKLGQPTVIGEIIAGIALGPSLFGALAPAASSFIFPPESLVNIQMLSQVGLILFMFVIGMELDLSVLKKKAGTAVIISHAGIVIPYTLGVVLSYFLYKVYAPANIMFYEFALFMGIAMSITAFPVLARIIKERGLSGTKLGTIAISCAAADDITAWCLLAAVIAIVRAGSVEATLVTLLLTVLFVVFMLYVVKPFLKYIASKKVEIPIIRQPIMALVLILLLLSSYYCEIVGVHALFGAFICGIVIPDKHDFKRKLTERIEDIALVLLLPLFFVYTGLRTQIGLLNEQEHWIVCALIIGVAVIGKFGGSSFAARLAGESLYDSLSIGALMNTRGLVELVVLNIGYDLGILTPQIFAMMVIMALVTTLMTSPAMNFLNRKFLKNKELTIDF